MVENENVVDLLISLTYSSATSGRKNLVFNPFPKNYIGNGNKNFDAVVKILDNFPSVAEMKKASNEKELIKIMGSNEYDLLKWILTENRVALLKMPEKKRIQEMGTEHQYMMLCDNPDRASKFAELR